MSTDLIIRCPKRTEYDSIADLWYNSWLSTGLEHSTKVARDDLRLRLETEEGRELLVAVKRGQVIGFLALRFDESKLDQLFIKPEHQRQGVGRLLVNVAKNIFPRECG